MEVSHVGHRQSYETIRVAPCGGNFTSVLGPKHGYLKTFWIGLTPRTAKIQYSQFPDLFRIFFIPDFLKFQNFAIPSPAQLLYDLIWNIKFIKPKLNISLFNISWYHTSKRGCLSIETKMNSLYRCQKGHIQYSPISKKPVTLQTGEINLISKIDKT